jgi:alpha 1,2-mannosyltransferase
MESIRPQYEVCIDPWIGFRTATVSKPLRDSFHADLSSISLRRLVLLAIFLTVTFITLIPLSTHHDSGPSTVHAISAFQPLRATLPATDKKRPDPIRWLKENSNNRYAVPKRGLPQLPLLGSHKPQGALISLIRNAELEGMMQSMRQLEFRWNRKYQVRLLFQIHALS